MPLNFRGVLNIINRANFGSSGSYTRFAADGRQTMVGEAMVYKDLWLPAAQWYGIEPNQWCNVFNASVSSATCTPSLRPLAANFGKDSGSTVQLPVLSASAGTNTDSRASTSFIAPSDAATSGSVEATLYFTSKLAMATTGSMEVFRLRYQYIGPGGSPGLLTSESGSILYGGSYAGLGNGVIEAWDLGMLPAFSYSASPLVLLELALEQSNACCMAGSAEESIIGLRLRYESNALGSQSQ